LGAWTWGIWTWGSGLNAPELIGRIDELFFAITATD
jgi:hypothetical protein